MIAADKGKKILFGHIENWFEDNGYHFKNHGDGQFRKESGDWTLAIIFNFYSSSTDHVNTTIFMHSREVESFIIDTGLPDFNFDSYRTGENLLFTIQDKRNLDSFMRKRREITLDSEQNYAEWASLIIEYMTYEANDFVEEYRYLPRVLQCLNNLEKNGKTNYLDILVGGIDHLFRALIISKLCSDFKYLEKQDRIDSIVLQDKYIKWHPYYTKLKKLLEGQTPLYFPEIN